MKRGPFVCLLDHLLRDFVFFCRFTSSVEIFFECETNSFGVIALIVVIVSCTRMTW